MKNVFHLSAHLEIVVKGNLNRLQSFEAIGVKFQTALVNVCNIPKCLIIIHYTHKSKYLHVKITVPALIP